MKVEWSDVPAYRREADGTFRFADFIIAFF
jgi:hypothetical protein